MPGNSRRKQVGAVDVDAPQPAHAVDRVVDGLKVLGEAGRGDEVVDLAVGRHDLGDAGLDRLRVRDVGVVRRHLGQPVVSTLCGAMRVSVRFHGCWVYGDHGGVHR